MKKIFKKKGSENEGQKAASLQNIVSEFNKKFNISKEEFDDFKVQNPVFNFKEYITSVIG